MCAEERLSAWNYAFSERNVVDKLRERKAYPTRCLCKPRSQKGLVGGVFSPDITVPAELDQFFICMALC